MPLGFERLNERSQRPNACINFIKPLKTTSPQDQKIAQDFLERIAAQCYPVMKKDYISVMALEEHEPNPEFLGRNFNAGEVIQLVLKDKSGRWLSFQFVQMVMMHELAHCKQMNHSRLFWKQRNQYADEMKELWRNKYVGEGLWGRGQDLVSGHFVHDRMPQNADIPEHLCGGTYKRARGKKRKRGAESSDQPKLTYAERQQKRIAKKFGVHGDGQGLGEDELVRGALESGKRHYAKPKVAKSKRGRELRANAALARFEAAKAQQTPEQTPELDEDDGSETESHDDEYGDGRPIFETLERIKDQRGRNLVRVCEDEGEQDEGDGQNELDDLRLMGSNTVKVDNADSASPVGSSTTSASKSNKRLYEDSETESEPEEDVTKARKPIKGIHEDSETESEPEEDVSVPKPQKPNVNSDPTGDITAGGVDDIGKVIGKIPETEAALATESTAAIATPTSITACSICSLENAPDSPTCMACSHVLKTKLMPNHWRCKSDACKGNKYVNAGDVGRCGLCGGQKPAVVSKPMSLTNADVLRWD